MTPLQYGVLGLLVLSGASAVGIVFDDALPSATEDDGYYYVAAGHISARFYPGTRSDRHCKRLQINERDASNYKLEMLNIDTGSWENATASYFPHVSHETPFRIRAAADLMFRVNIRQASWGGCGIEYQQMNELGTLSEMFFDSE